MKKWLDALKQFNQGKTEWCIPKKGSAEYEQVKGIMTGETPAGKKKAKREAVDMVNIVTEKRVRKPKQRE